DVLVENQGCWGNAEFIPHDSGATNPDATAEKMMCSQIDGPLAEAARPLAMNETTRRPVLCAPECRPAHDSMIAAH
ncbi:MAG: hypothetical protein ABIR71_09095, partial [Chthoniobacterales bacterium]